MQPENRSMPEPQTPTERLLYIGVVMSVAAIITIGGFAAWMIFAATGTIFPDEAKLIVFGALTFLFGGSFGIASKK